MTIPGGFTRFQPSTAGAEEIDDSAGCGEGVALGRGEADVECGFELIAEFDQVKGVSTKISNKGGVETHLRRREVEVPCDDGLDACLNRSFHLPSSLPHKCQGNVNDRQFREATTVA